MTESEQLKRVVAQLILRHPFLATLAVRLQRFDDPTTQSAWTDGERLGVNPDFLAGLNDNVRLTLLAHELYHVALAVAAATSTAGTGPATMRSTRSSSTTASSSGTAPSTSPPLGMPTPRRSTTSCRHHPPPRRRPPLPEALPLPVGPALPRLAHNRPLQPGRTPRPLPNLASPNTSGRSGICPFRRRRPRTSVKTSSPSTRS
jgi:Putative metallopeptidase domain